jgi:hypothetical protein
MQESLTQLRKKEYPAGEHPEEECMYRKRNYKKIKKSAAGTAPILEISIISPDQQSTWRKISIFSPAQQSHLA